MKPGPLCARVMDAVEDLMTFKILTCIQTRYLTDRYSERVESPEDLSARTNTSKAIGTE